MGHRKGRSERGHLMDQANFGIQGLLVQSGEPTFHLFGGVKRPDDGETLDALLKEGVDAGHQHSNLTIELSRTIFEPQGQGDQRRAHQGQDQRQFQIEPSHGPQDTEE